jgi:hypothetical protein
MRGTVASNKYHAENRSLSNVEGKDDSIEPETA